MSLLVKRALSLFIIYWILMVFLGYELSFYTLKFVDNLDVNYLSVARNYLLVGLVLFVIGARWAGVKFKENTIENKSFSFALVPFFFVFFLCSSIFFVTYNAVGYIPVFHTVYGAKYFQDVNDVYIPYRPYYTLAINLSVAALMSLFIIYFYADSAREKKNIIFLVLMFVFILFLTGKRGPILVSFAYLFMGMYLIGRIKILSLSIVFSVLILMAALLHYIFNSQEVFFVGMLDSASSSFFVGVRELARFLTNFDGNYLYGLTYWASATSFIPTSVYELKDLYLYPRYLIHLEGGDPNLSGGPRATYVGEALANFGLFGFIVISWLFGAVFYSVYRLLLLQCFFRGNEMAFGFMGAFVLQQFILAFFENGSAFLFHFVSKLLFIYVLLTVSNKYSKRVAEI